MYLLKSVIKHCALLVGTPLISVAQIPQDIPNQSEPVDFTSGWNILIYIVLPILMGIYYYFWRKKQRKK
jgi:hypothetical protein